MNKSKQKSGRKLRNHDLGTTADKSGREKIVHMSDDDLKEEVISGILQIDEFLGDQTLECDFLFRPMDGICMNVNGIKTIQTIYFQEYQDPRFVFALFDHIVMEHRMKLDRAYHFKQLRALAIEVMTDSTLVLATREVGTGQVTEETARILGAISDRVKALS